MPLHFPIPTTSKISAHSLQNGSPAQHVTAFRACLQQFQDCLEFAGSTSVSPVVEAATNFVLDFDIIARRAMGADSERYKLFQLHFLKNASRQVCCTKLKLSEWTFATELRTIEQLLGKGFSNAGLFPLTPYFAGTRAGLERIAA